MRRHSMCAGVESDLRPGVYYEGVRQCPLNVPSSGNSDPRIPSRSSAGDALPAAGTCGQLMVESLDAYRLANYVRAHGRPDIEMVDIINDYTEPDILPGNYPIFLMKVQGPDDACVFLKEGACSVYPARPRACRLYPFTVDIGVRGHDFNWYQCLDRPFHFSRGKVLVKDWFYRNFSKEERAFVLQEWKNVPEIGNLIRDLDDSALDAAHLDILLMRYTYFDLEQPFLPQYERNTEELLRRLGRLRGPAEGETPHAQKLPSDGDRTTAPEEKE
mgnify:CR=1 FL=1